jgi:hypothetical protein
MIAYIALALSVINSVLWVVFVIAIRKLFNKMLPMLTMMGIGSVVNQSQNLTTTEKFGTMAVPGKLRDAESDK